MMRWKLCPMHFLPHAMCEWVLRVQVLYSQKQDHFVKKKKKEARALTKMLMSFIIY
jgi:hypothetical protein